MGIVFDSLTQNDKILISDYIEDYGPDEYDNVNLQNRASLDYVLRFWDKAKTDLFYLFNKQLIVKKEIDIKACVRDKKNELNDLSNMPFCEAIRRAIYNNHIVIMHEKKEGEYYYDNLCLMLKNHESLYQNIVPEDFTVLINLTSEKIEFKKGAKMMHPLRKLATALKLEDAFEDFRLSQSMIHNDGRLIGNLCLSIHPLDFMTMSDNNYDWDSCMSWKGCGDYRSGTVEMMNSPYVIVAYLEGDRPFYLHGNEKWNNKKWRILVVIDKSFTCSIKAYCYYNSALIEEVMKFITELAQENWGITYEPVDSIHRPGLHDFTDEYWLGKWPGTEDYYKINFSTYKMYNDFGRTTHYMLANRAFNKPNGNKTWDDSTSYWDINAEADVDINYHGIEFFIGGEFNCMWCGETERYSNYDYESSVMCKNCCEVTPEYIAECEECGCGIEDGEDYIYIHGSYYCEDCGCRIANPCASCGNWDYNEDLKPMLISYKDVKWNKEKINEYNENFDINHKQSVSPFYCKECYNKVIYNLSKYEINTNDLLDENKEDYDDIPYIKNAVNGDALMEIIKTKKTSDFFSNFTSVFCVYNWSFYDWWYRYFSGSRYFWLDKSLQNTLVEKFNKMIIALKEEFPDERVVSMFRLKQ